MPKPTKDDLDFIIQVAFARIEEFRKEIMHDRGCWCPSCFIEK